MKKIKKSKALLWRREMRDFGVKETIRLLVFESRERERGISFQTILRNLRLKKSQVLENLRQLEQENWVKEISPGRWRLFYPLGEEKFLSVLEMLPKWWKGRSRNH